MTRNDYENKGFEDLMVQLSEENDNITTQEMLKEFAITNINNDNLFVAIHILEAIQKDDAEWYEYDYSMGTLQTPSGLTEKYDIEHLIED
jgi:hypothetical protein